MEENEGGNRVFMQRKSDSRLAGRLLGARETEIHPHSNSKTSTKLHSKDDASVDRYNLQKSKCTETYRYNDYNKCNENTRPFPDFDHVKHSKCGQWNRPIHGAIGLEKQENENGLEKSGEVTGGTGGKENRSQCMHMPEGANSGSKHSFLLLFESAEISSPLHAFHDPSLMPDKYEERSSTSMKSGSAVKYSKEPEREANEPPMTLLRDLGQLRKRNFKKHNEPHCSTLPPPDNKIEGYFRTKKLKLKEDFETRDLCTRPVVLPFGKTNVLASGTCSGNFPINLNADIKDQSGNEFGNKAEEYLGFGTHKIDHRNGLEILLTDVPLTVQASHRAEHVPFVCLVSKLNGMAILGHPLQTEELNDSSHTCPRKEVVAGKLFGSDGNKFHQLVWKTSKRSPVIYVTNSSASSAALDKQAALGGPKENVLARRQPSSVDSRGKPGQFKKFAVPLRRTCVPVKLVISKILIAVG